MFYIVTRRFAEDSSDGSKILGIYSSEDEARSIKDEYMKHAPYETVEIQYISNNVKLSDLTKVKPYRTKNGDDFIKKYIPYTISRFNVAPLSLSLSLTLSFSSG